MTGGATRMTLERAIRKTACMVVLVILMAGCTAATKKASWPTPGLGSNMIGTVPFYAQEAYQCGPASLAMVLNHAGDRVSPATIADSVFRKNIRGTVSLDMALYPRNRGFNSRFGAGTPQSLVQNVNDGRPIVVMINQGFSMVRKLHYMVIIGYSPEGIVAHTGTERAKRIPWSEFLPQWEETGRWMLVVLPRGGVS